MEEQIAAKSNDVVSKLFYYGMARFIGLFFIASTLPIALYHYFAGAAISNTHVLFVLVVWALVVLSVMSVYAVCYYRSLKTTISPMCHLASAGEQSKAIAHDVRGPLTGIQVAVRHLKTIRGVDDSNFEQCVQLLDKSTTRLFRVADEFLEQQESPGRHDIHKLIEGLVEEYRARLDLSEVNIDVALNADDPHVHGQIRRVERVISNVVKNAIEAMELAGNITISTSTTSEGKVCVSIADTGGGMPPEIVQAIMSGKASSKRRGHGIGLQFVQQVISEHGGTLQINSKVGHGTTMSFSLPNANQHSNVVQMRKSA